ncbi:TetR/AcrR family transcriptional regulator [Microbacterium sp. ASV49]|uniref:Helix-turn-helix domain-containing protein n=1 Tax=Microbacterium candidum TaxID=3041922 RepID=A0ABT7N4H5_9MICO|nr:TetR/AcrR family transcriptional regulator [Microbacterium sp. ASV49]MDL9981610.1 helix-turn-helix domain-containing protein [Microbacterium sp. ASV49]
MKTATRSRENTRARLMDAAFEVFAEVGLDAASVEAICDRAGFTRGAFYSNFDSKDELFLDLAARVASARVESVQSRIGGLVAAGPEGFDEGEIASILEQVLDVGADDRLGVLLMSEIRIRALRDPDVAQAFLAQDAAMQRSIAQIITDVATIKGIGLRMDAGQAALLMLTVWESSAVRALIQGVADESQGGEAALRAAASVHLNEVARLILC